MARSQSPWIFVPLLAGAVAMGACDRPPSVELREWTPGDHDGEQKTSATGAQAPRGGGGDGLTAIADATWRQQCASCHGDGGRGDGPQGPMFKATDLTRDDWQGSVTDEQIAKAITDGKGRMPSFDLPEDVVRGLVARVRSLRGR